MGTITKKALGTPKVPLLHPWFLLSSGILLYSSFPRAAFFAYFHVSMYLTSLHFPYDSSSFCWSLSPTCKFSGEIMHLVQVRSEVLSWAHQLWQEEGLAQGGSNADVSACGWGRRVRQNTCVSQGHTHPFGWLGGRHLGVSWLEVSLREWGMAPELGWTGLIRYIWLQKTKTYVGH